MVVWPERSDDPMLPEPVPADALEAARKATAEEDRFFQQSAKRFLPEAEKLSRPTPEQRSQPE